MKPKISVIIPIYNVEKYLDRCLYSVRQQTLLDIEIICVNDCSPDNSDKIIEQHAIEDSRIRVIHHENNLGLGGARNSAIRIAKANYIASVDSDDYMLPNMLNKLWSETENGKIDIVCCGFKKVDENDRELDSQHFAPQLINNIDNSVNIFSNINPAFWNKLWRRSLFVENNIFFPNHLYFEDMPTTPRIIAKASSIKIIDDVLYHYSIRPTSITSSYSPKHILDYYRGFEILVDFLEEHNLFKRYKDELITYINTNMQFYSQKLIDSDMDTNEKKQYLRHLLMLKISFIEYFDLIKSKNMEALHSLLASAKTKEELT